MFTPRTSDNKTAHDEGHDICVWGNNRVLIENMELHGLTGDGSLVLDSNDVSFVNNNIHNNRRQGISIVGGVRIEVVDNQMEQGDGNKNVDGPIVSWHKTHNIIARNTITMVEGSVNGRLGYIQYSSGGDKGHNRATFVHGNINATSYASGNHLGEQLQDIPLTQTDPHTLQCVLDGW